MAQRSVLFLKPLASAIYNVQRHQLFGSRICPPGKSRSQVLGNGFRGTAGYGAAWLYVIRNVSDANTVISSYPCAGTQLQAAIIHLTRNDLQYLIQHHAAARHRTELTPLDRSLTADFTTPSYQIFCRTAPKSECMSCVSTEVNRTWPSFY